MHIDVVPNRGSRPAYLLRESYRQGPRVRKRTLANLSSLSDEQIFAIRAVLRGESLQPAEVRFEVIGSRAHGHVQAVRVAMQRLGLEGLLGGRRSPERDRVLAMIGLHPKKWTPTFEVFTIADGGVRCKGFRNGGTRLSSGPRR